MSDTALRARVLALIEATRDGTRDDVALDALLADMREHQAARIPAYARLRAVRGDDAALPTDVFRHVRVATHSPRDDVRVFLTSGTTSGARGAHAFAELSLYDAAAQAAARALLFPDRERMDLVIAAPHPDDAPDSSLSYMLGRFEEWFGNDTSWCWQQGPDLDALSRKIRTDRPLALLATSFALVHIMDELRGDFRLPDGSRIMLTGGFKGRSRTLEPNEMREALAARFGVPEPSIVAEYGMTELSSQLYETTLREPDARRRLKPPGWVKVSVVHPDTLAPVRAGDIGIVRIDDAANLHSCCSIQTADLACIVDDGIELRGRDPTAVPRGCSLAVEEALAR